ncbi:MAG: toll/interleukin-1 receptor domain-containing protein [Pseudomonadota bacterium]
MVSPGAGPRARVFLSYSREDRDFVDALKLYLETCGFEIFIDRKSITAGEGWEARLEHLLASADTTVCVVSKHWLGSDVCRHELTLANESGRRVLPVFIDGSDPESAPPEIARLQVLSIPVEGAVAKPEVAEGIKRLVDALNTDIDWVREQSRLLDRTRDWLSGGRASAHLMRGDPLAHAKAWRALPVPPHVAVSEQVLEYLEASENAELDHQRRQVRGRLWRFGLAASTLTAIAGIIAIWALSQAQISDGKLELAEERAARAEAEALAAELQAKADRDEAEAAAETTLVHATLKASDRGEIVVEPTIPLPGRDEIANAAASRLAIDLNSADRSTRLLAGQQVATLLRDGDPESREDMANALVDQLSIANLEQLSASGRFNMLYMLNTLDDPAREAGVELLLALDTIEARRGEGIAIGTQTQDCIDNLRAKLTSPLDLPDTCGGR